MVLIWCVNTYIRICYSDVNRDMEVYDVDAIHAPRIPNRVYFSISLAFKTLSRAATRSGLIYSGIGLVVLR